MSKKGSSIYNILVFSFADTQTAGEMVKELKSQQKLEGYKVVAEAVVVREADGSIKVHEPGKGGRDAAIGAAVGGALGLFGGPVGVLWLAAAGGSIGGVIGHFAGRAIPKKDLEQIGEQLQPNSSAFMALVEDTDAEAIVNSMAGYNANVITVTLGDELSGTISQVTEADIEVTAPETGQAAQPATEQAEKPATEQAEKPSTEQAEKPAANS
jgi:uncharacterized membrane protein